MHRTLACLSIVLLSLLLTGCGGDDQPASIKLSARLGTGFVPPVESTLAAYAGFTTGPDMVVAVPHRNGVAGVADVSRAKEVLLISGGAFELELETEWDWIVFLVASNAPLHERIVAYVTIPATEDSMVNMPVSKAKGDADLGTIDRTDDGEARAETDTTAATKVFSLNVADMDFIAQVDSSLKQIANNYLNYNPATGVYYESAVTTGWAARLADVDSASPEQYGYRGITFQVFTNDPALVDGFEELCDGTLPLAISTGGLVRLFEGGTLSGFDNRNAVSDGPSSCSAPGLGLYANGDVIQISINNGLATTGEAYWNLKLDGEDIAAFGFAYSNPVSIAYSDQTPSHPSVPVPVPRPQFDQEGNLSQVNVDWYIYSTYQEAFFPVPVPTLELLVSDSFVGLSSDIGATEVVSSTEDEKVITQAEFSQQWSIELARGGQPSREGKNLQEIKIQYTLAGNAYSFIWTTNPFCQDDQVTSWMGEVCDREDLAGETCESLGFGEGALACDRTCQLDTYDCGDGLKWHWEQTGSMSETRMDHRAVRLLDGTVLVTGGIGDNGYLASAEIYDPQTRTFSPTGSMSQARWRHTITLLGDGRVLVAGGTGGDTADRTVELYDPSTGLFSPYGTLSVSRYGHTATYFENEQRVLFLGGDSNPPGSTGDWFDVFANERMDITLELAIHRRNHTADLLPTGDLVIIGGEALYAWKSAEMVPNGELALASLLPDSMKEYRTRHRTALLPDGSLLIYGGVGGWRHELNDPSQNRLVELFFEDGRYEFSLAPTTTSMRDHTLTTLPSGHVFSTGWTGSLCDYVDCTSQDIYYPAAKTVRRVTSPTIENKMNQPRGGHIAVALEDGTVLFAGGRASGFGYLASAELLVTE